MIIGGGDQRAAEPTAWFDRLYAEARRVRLSLPWDRTEAQLFSRSGSSGERIDA